MLAIESIEDRYCRRVAQCRSEDLPLSSSASCLQITKRQPARRSAGCKFIHSATPAAGLLPSSTAQSLCA